MGIAVATALLGFAAAGPVSAQNATWSGPGDDWSVGANWTGGAPPSGVATFNGANPTTIFSSADVTVQAMRFTGSTAYTFDICGCFVMTVTGQGVVNDSTVTQTFVVDGGTLNFLNSSTIGPNVDIFNQFGGATVFGNSFGDGTDRASAGQANIVNQFFGTTAFFGNTSAGNAVITNGLLGATYFLEASSAANATITNDAGGELAFGSPFGSDTATAGFARIFNLNGSYIVFQANTTAGNATIVNESTMEFMNGATAGDAVITTQNDGSTIFIGRSTGGNARFITDNNLNSTVDFSFTFGPNLDGVVTAGSIEGGGSFIVGSNNLIVGSNNLSTLVTGIVDVCGCGALTKIGSGTLTLALDPTWSWLFSGSLIVNGGTVVVDSDLSLAFDATANHGGTLAGAGILPPTFINGGTLSPGNGTSGNIAQLTVAQQLVFAGNGTYRTDVAPSHASGLVFGLADYTFVVPYFGFSPTALAGIINAVGTGGGGYTLGARYPVLAAVDGFNGTRFDRLFISGSFGSMRPIVTYDPLDDTVYLQLIQGEVSSQLAKGASQNQIALAAGLDNALKNGADFGAFTPLYNLSGDAFLQALDQLSGEANTGIFQAVYQSVGNFINSMLKSVQQRPRRFRSGDALCGRG